MEAATLSSPDDRPSTTLTRATDADELVALLGVELRCSACGYGVVVRTEPVSCPMCGDAAWEQPSRPHRASGWVN